MSMRLGLFTVGLLNLGDGYFVDHMIAKYSARDVSRSAHWVLHVVPRHLDYTLPEWAQHAVAKLMLLPTDATGFARLEDIGTVKYSRSGTCKVTVIVPNEHADMWSELS
jgi:hypothetical protein